MPFDGVVETDPVLGVGESVSIVIGDQAVDRDTGARSETTILSCRYVGDPDIPEQEGDIRTRSPITMADRITTPLLDAQGADDVRVVQAESQLFTLYARVNGGRVRGKFARSGIPT